MPRLLRGSVQLGFISHRSEDSATRDKTPFVPLTETDDAEQAAFPTYRDSADHYRMRVGSVDWFSRAIGGASQSDCLESGKSWIEDLHFQD